MCAVLNYEQNTINVSSFFKHDDRVNHCSLDYTCYSGSRTWIPSIHNQHYATCNANNYMAPWRTIGLRRLTSDSKYKCRKYSHLSDRMSIGEFFLLLFNTNIGTCTDHTRDDANVGLARESRYCE